MRHYNIFLSENGVDTVSNIFDYHIFFLRREKDEQLQLRRISYTQLKSVSTEELSQTCFCAFILISDKVFRDILRTKKDRILLR